MYILKNAWVSITRNKGRNILIGIIIVVISCACAVTLAIKNSANKLIESYENQYQVEASIGVNRKEMMENFNPSSSDKDSLIDNYNSIDSISIDDIKNYADSNYVSSYYYTTSVGMDSDTLESASMTKQSDNTSSSDGSTKRQMPQGGGNFSTTDFTLTGYSSYDAMTNFIDGSYTIIDGNVDSNFTANSCVINSELATLNDISVGDTITLVDSDDSSITYDLIVTGIYEENSNSASTNRMSMFSNSVNTIITNTTVIENVSALDSNITVKTTPTFTLTSKDVIDAFTSEVENKGLNESLTVTTNLDEVENSTSTISNVSSFATTFLVITLIIGSIVLFIINMINVRERKYEIGVLRTIGMKKSLLTGQFMVELLIISLVSLLIGAGIGSVISVPVSNSLLQNEINSSSEQASNISSNFGGMGPSENGNSDSTNSKQNSNSKKINGVVSVQAFSSIDAAVDLKVLLELLFIGICLTIVSSLASMISIQKFSPLTILKERS